MKLFQYLLLSVFISLSAFGFTCIVFTITHDACMVVFCTAAIAILIALDNMELDRLIEARDAEILALKSTAQVTLACRTNELENEIRRLLKPLPPPHVWKRGWRSCSSLP